MAGGTVTQGNVSWTIDGNTRDGGNWDGTFHSEIATYAGHIPDGLTGTFDAEHTAPCRQASRSLRHTQTIEIVSWRIQGRRIRLRPPLDFCTEDLKLKIPFSFSGRV